MRWWRKPQTAPAETISDRWWPRYAAAHQAHTEMVPRLQPLQRTLTDITISLSDHPMLQYPERECRLYRHEAFARLLEYSGGAVLALEHKLYAGALAQALALIEQVIDLHYLVLDVPGTARLDALLRHTLAQARQRLQAWQSDAQRRDPAEGEAVRRRQHHLLALSAGLALRGGGVWPGLQHRARAIGSEPQYHALFAEGMDATTRFNERLGILICRLRGAEEDGEEVLTAWDAERASHAVYTAVCALRCYGGLLALLLEDTQASADMLTRLRQATQALRGIMKDCEQTYAEFGTLLVSEATPDDEGMSAMP